MFSEDILVPQNIRVINNAVLTIKNNATVFVDLKNYSVTVKKGSGILIKKGSTLKQGTKETAVLSVQSDDPVETRGTVSADSGISAQSVSSEIKTLSLGYTPQQSSFVILGLRDSEETGI